MSLEEQSLDAASRCPLSRAAIAQLAVNLPVEAGDQLVLRALEERGPETSLDDLYEALFTQLQSNGVFTDAAQVSRLINITELFDPEMVQSA